MRILAALALLMIAAQATAAEPKPPSGAKSDPRIAFRLADLRRDNWRCLMRGHLSALTEAMRRLSDGDYEGAALLTETHYALIPDTAEYCEERMFTKEESIAAARLPPAAPDPLPQMFNAMHDAARAFAAEARRAKLSGDSTVAWKALAAMSTYCDACHAGYRLE